MRHYLAALFVVAIFTIPWFAENHPAEFTVALNAIKSTGSQLAAVLLSHNPKSVAEIQSKYATTTPAVRSKVRILVVPGHEPKYGGAEFGNVKERELVVVLGDQLTKFLRENGHYDVTQTRESDSWNPIFETYFKNSANEIRAWQKASHQEMAQLISVGSVSKPQSKVYHNNAPADVAMRLYGITKWANENDIDITIHIHFNDAPDHGPGVPGKHSGFTIYVPEKQYANSTTTKAVASSIYKRLAKYNPVSDLGGEDEGIVEDPKLIAVGVNNTADSASMLIEYGYIYEKQFTDPKLRDLAIKDLAFQTYLGLQDFFGSGNDVSLNYDTLMLPYTFAGSLTQSNPSSKEVFALQTALLLDGVYPPKDRTKNDCPRSGTIGPCTKTAIEAFQKKYGISGEKGAVGEKTLELLNKQHSIKSL